MFAPVVPGAPATRPSQRNLTRQRSGGLHTHPEDPSEDRVGGAHGLPPLLARQRSKRGSLRRDDGSTNPGAVAIARKRSTRNSFQKLVTQSPIAAASPIPVVKKEVPAHLAKFLQKTPQQAAELEAVKAILIDDPGHRNELSLDVVYDWMLHNCKQYSNNIFGSAPEYIRREICRQMRLIKCTSNQLIIRQGDTGDRCYIVIDGIVDVYVQKDPPPVVTADPLEDRSSSLAMRRDSRRPSFATAAVGTSADSLTGMPTVVPKEYGVMVANLGPGAMFGEVVLMNPSARRNATILASQYADTCDLIFLERADYIRLVRGASMEASHYNQAEILDHMWLFQGWSKHDKMRLVSAMRSLQFTTNDCLYRAGTESKWMFIISTGEVVERVNWTVGKANAGQLSGSSSGGIGAGPSHGKAAPEAKVSIELMLVGPGDVVGELPFIKNKWSAAFDIRAVGDVHALAIDRRVFESMILDTKPEGNRAASTTHQKLQKLSEEREDWRAQRMECGAAYPDAHISMTWQLMRMSALRCARCGQRGHLPIDLGRCGCPSPTKSTTAPASSSKRTAANLSPIKPAHGSPRRDPVVRELFDEGYLPSAREQLQLCRLEDERRKKQSALPNPGRTPSTGDVAGGQLPPLPTSPR